MRSVVRLTASATSALPRWLLLTICVVYASFGLFGRDPWKNEDAAGFGVMWTMANGSLHDWMLPNLVGKYITSDAPVSSASPSSPATACWRLEAKSMSRAW